MKRIALLGFVLCSLAPTALLAQSSVDSSSKMSYSGVDISYLADVEIDNTNIDGDGLELGGSYSLNDKFYLLGSWQEQSFEQGIDGRQMEFGGGFHTSLGKTVDFVATLSYIDAKIDTSFGSADDDGLALGGGVRARVSDSFEVGANLKFVDFDNAGSDTGYTFGGRWFFSDSMAITASADFFDEVDVLRVGFRAEF